MNEISLTIIDRENKHHLLKGPTDMNMNIMEICKAYDLPVIGECGGMAMCATCQCYLESETVLPPQSDAELDMLDQAFYVKENSRLGCQIQLSDEIEGISFTLSSRITNFYFFLFSAKTFLNFSTFGRTTAWQYIF